MRKSVIIHIDSLDILDELKNEQAGILFKAIKSYLKKEEFSLDFALKIAFIPFKNQFERDDVKYKKTVERNTINGSKPKKPLAPSRTQSKPKKPLAADNKNDNKNDNDKDNSFILFWNLYNKKVGDKEKCLLKWKKLGSLDKAKIMETLPTFLKTITDKKFQPHPDTYLNNKRWQDELDIKKEIPHPYTLQEIDRARKENNIFGAPGVWFDKQYISVL